MSRITHYVTADGNPIVEVYIGPEHEPFGLCYECRDCGPSWRPRHDLCVGIPCECPCPILPNPARARG